MTGNGAKTWLAAWALAAAAGCTGEPEPVAAVRAYLEAARRGDCEAVWSWLSEASRANAREWAPGESSARREPVDPLELHCRSAPTHIYSRELELVVADEARAEVRGIYYEGKDFLIPGFWPTRWEKVPVPLALVREEGQWRVDRPRVPVREAHHAVSRLGQVTVSRSLRGNPETQLVEATASPDRSFDQLEEVLRDPALWGPLLPGVVAGRAIEGGGERDWQRVALAFDSGAEVEVEARGYGRLERAELPWTVLQFRAGHPDRDETMYTGEFGLHARGVTPQPTIELSVVVRPKQWPEASAAHHLSNEAMAQALEGWIARAGALAAAETRAP